MDCVELSALCYRGPAAACGNIGISANADLDAWDAVYGEWTSSCECEGADPCGSELLCNEQRECEAVFGGQAFCTSAALDVEAFLAANRACEVDDDCVQLQSTCHVDDCSVVVVSVDTDPQDWERLDSRLRRCQTDPEEVCNYVGECGAQHRCNDAGLCESYR
ncbi:MAG: hypothetical protein ACRBN8_13010 [Nannocystales bacterium]